MTGNMTNKLILILLAVTVSGSVMYAQKTDISVRAYPSSWYNGYFEPGMDGGGLMIGYHRLISPKTRLNVYAEFSVLRSRNELMLGLGLRRIIWQKNRFGFSGDVNILNGFDLYRPSLLYVGGAELLAEAEYRIGRRLYLFLSAGGRYTVCPGYRKFVIWRYNSWPVGIGIRF